MQKQIEDLVSSQGQKWETQQLATQPADFLAPPHLHPLPAERKAAVAASVAAPSILRTVDSSCAWTRRRAAARPTNYCLAPLSRSTWIAGWFSYLMATARGVSPSEFLALMSAPASSSACTTSC